MLTDSSTNTGWCSQHGTYLGMHCPICGITASGSMTVQGPRQTDDHEFRIGLLEAEIVTLRALVKRLLVEKGDV